MKLFLLFFIPAVAANPVTVFRLPLPFFNIEFRTTSGCNEGQTSIFGTICSHSTRIISPTRTPTQTLTRMSASTPMVQRLTPISIQRPNSIIPSNMRDNTNAPSIRTLSENRQTEAQPTRNTEIPTVNPSTRSSNGRLQFQTRVEPFSVASQNTIIGSPEAPITRSSTNVPQEQDNSPPGNLARQASLLMSKNRNGSRSPSARTSVRTTTRGPPCVTPDGENGICGHISNCKFYEPYMEMMNQPTVLNYFRDRVCRLLSMEIHVCCPTSPLAQGPQLRPESGSVKNDCIPAPNRLVGGQEVSTFLARNC
ncbi:hypothetical protein SK128_012279 [Halocaridina rubra]|uniref:Clip domain-containing protein n=1 Tax=Halocaridina rubra TaxID=373956 RepID=A0AAN9A6J7_HALRR